MSNLVSVGVHKMWWFAILMAKLHISTCFPCILLVLLAEWLVEYNVLCIYNYIYRSIKNKNCEAQENSVLTCLHFFSFDCAAQTVIFNSCTTWPRVWYTVTVLVTGWFFIVIDGIIWKWFKMAAAVYKL